MMKDSDQIASPDSTNDRVVFVEQGIRHSFQYEGAGPEPDREDPFLRVNLVSVHVIDQERSERFFWGQLGFRLMERTLSIRLSLDRGRPAGWISEAGAGPAFPRFC